MHDRFHRGATGRWLPPVLLLLLLVGVAGGIRASDEEGAVAAEPSEEQVARFRGSTEVVASRVAEEPALSGRRQVVLTREEIAALPVQTLQDVLAVLPGVGLSRRGARGVQGDLGLRGGTFEQVAVLVNGVRVNNPQTGHHNLDLFLPAAAIERVEVLLGPGSAMYGPDAFGGAVNIVTGVPEAAAFVRVGSHHLSGGGVAARTRSGLWAALEREVHSGFRDDTEADVNQAAGGWSWQDGDSSLQLLAAAGERRFGAWSFYSASFPNELEETGGELLSCRAGARLGRTGLSLALRLDRHRDLFILDRERPDWYRNCHHTRGVLITLVADGELAGWAWAAGVEGARDEIDSSNLGRHHRVRSAAFLELGRHAERLSGGLQLRLDQQDPWGTVSSIAGGGSWQLRGAWRLRLHHGESFRAPSFTELYYRSPARVGNPDLGPEHGRTSEAGLDGKYWSLTVFSRRADPIIDYLLGDDLVWRARNIGRVTTRGVEAELVLPRWGALQWQRLGAVLLDSTIDVDPQRSTYALAHPELELAWTGALSLGTTWRAGWAVRYRDPRDAGSWVTTDLRLERRLQERCTVRLEASNLFDRRLSELHGIPLPGRWLTLTLRYTPRR